MSQRFPRDPSPRLHCRKFLQPSSTSPIFIHNFINNQWLIQTGSEFAWWLLAPQLQTVSILNRRLQIVELLFKQCIDVTTYHWEARMKKLQKWLLAACWYSLAMPVIAGPMVSLHANPEKLHPPENLLIDIVISGLQSGGVNTLLGAFDLSLTYNPLLVNLSTGAPSSLGSGLGDPTDPLQVIKGANASVPGVFEFFEVSLLEESASTCVICTGPYLADLQSDSFTLATLSFYAPSLVGAPFAAFGLDAGSAIFGDAAGNPIAGIQVQRELIVDIPEPNPCLLFALGAFAAAVASRRRLQEQIKTGRPTCAI
ncbi:hypothetical protein [Duganella hordei]|uniref:hypothetical protein n=1 Tax=Duganella hordei TaxID=2865934 RepID=UPI0033422281